LEGILRFRTFLQKFYPTTLIVY